MPSTVPSLMPAITSAPSSKPASCTLPSLPVCFSTSTASVELYSNSPVISASFGCLIMTSSMFALALARSKLSVHVPTIT